MYHKINVFIILLTSVTHIFVGAAASSQASSSCAMASPDNSTFDDRHDAAHLIGFASEGDCEIRSCLTKRHLACAIASAGKQHFSQEQLRDVASHVLGLRVEGWKSVNDVGSFFSCSSIEMFGCKVLEPKAALCVSFVMNRDNMALSVTRACKDDGSMMLKTVAVPSGASLLLLKITEKEYAMRPFDLQSGKTLQDFAQQVRGEASLMIVINRQELLKHLSLKKSKT